VGAPHPPTPRVTQKKQGTNIYILTLIDIDNNHKNDGGGGD
jgi:hypothetical protein